MYFGLGYATNSWKITQTDYCKIEKGTYSSFKDDIWGANLADMQLVSKFNKGIRFSLCVIDIYSKYACVVPLKGKIGVTAFNLLQNILDDSTELHSIRQPNKIWVNKGSESYDNSFKKWLKDNDIEMYSTHNKGKSVVV